MCSVRELCPPSTEVISKEVIQGVLHLDKQPNATLTARDNTAQISKQRGLQSDILKEKITRVVRRRTLMPFTITQLPSHDKLCNTFRLPILERFYDRKTIEELITSFHHQPTRARKLTMTIVI